MSNRTDINNLGEITRDTRDSLQAHYKECKDKKRFRIEMIAPYLSVAVAVAAVLVAVLI